MLVNSNLKVLGLTKSVGLTTSRPKFCLMLPATGSAYVNIGRTLQTNYASHFMIVLEVVIGSKIVVFIWEFTVLIALISMGEKCFAIISHGKVK